MSPAVIDYATLIGTLISVIGLGVALWQLRRTRAAAEAAEAAAASARESFAQTLQGADIARCAGVLDEVRTQVRAQRFEPALLRISDLSSLLVQLKEIPNSQFDFQPVLVQLSVVRQLLESRVADDEFELDRTRMLRTLSTISDDVNSWLGQVRFVGQENSQP